MARRNQPIDPNQGELVSFLPQAGIEVAVDVYASPKPEDGPSVDILERSKHLGNALTALSSASMLGGLEIASDTPSLRGGLERRYDDVDALAGHSHDARHNHMETAKKAFAHASGHHTLVAAYPDKVDEIKQNSRELYSDFIKEFADSKGATSRRKMQKKLIKQQQVFSQTRSAGRVN